jgi:N-acetylmuramoyl-L-alanine amidase
MLLMVRTALALGLLLVLAVSAIALQGSPAALERDAAARPHIVQNPIPFPASRKHQTRRYARRHYGLDTYKLELPKVIVQHFTASTSFQSAYNTFASNQPDVELHERPGVCAHFLVARDGTIHQLVSLRLMCRHTIGLNWTAVGIEHVGISDGDIMGNRRQLAASLRLTRWLQGRLAVRTRNVIGHAESLSSPYHHERVARLRKQTHGDFARPAMRRYRARL